MENFENKPERSAEAQEILMKHEDWVEAKKAELGKSDWIREIMNKRVAVEALEDDLAPLLAEYGRIEN